MRYSDNILSADVLHRIRLKLRGRIDSASLSRSIYPQSGWLPGARQYYELDRGTDEAACLVAVQLDHHVQIFVHVPWQQWASSWPPLLRAPIVLAQGHGQCSCASGAVPQRWGSSSGHDYLSLTHTTTFSSFTTMFRSLEALGIILLIPISACTFTLPEREPMQPTDLSTDAQTTPNILCIPGQCLQGTFNTTSACSILE